MPILSVPLTQDGPIVTVLIGVSEPRKLALEQSGQKVPKQLQIGALLNTGATGTVVDRQIIRRLGLQPRGVVNFKSTQQGMVPEMSMTYDISLSLANAPHQFITSALAVLEGSFALPTYQAILGRDVLGHLKLHYDGINRMLTVQF